MPMTVPPSRNVAGATGTGVTGETGATGATGATTAADPALLPPPQAVSPADSATSRTVRAAAQEFKSRIPSLQNYRYESFIHTLIEHLPSIQVPIRHQCRNSLTPTTLVYYITTTPHQQPTAREVACSTHRPPPPGSIDHDDSRLE
jgi:hypothetical protein